LLSAHKSQNSITKALVTDLNIVVVIPCYNVEKTIACVVAGMPSYVRWVVLVDDASRDRTAEIVDSLKSERIRVIHLPENRGVGGATMRGYEEALALGADVIVKVDGDGQMNPAYLIPLIAPILMNQADYTKGNRFLHADQIKSMPLIRRIGNAGLSFLTKAASGYWDIFDPTNGYTAIHASIVPLLDTNKLHRRYFFESSMLIQLGMIRAVIQDVEIPAKYQDEVSSLSEWKALFEFPPRLLAGFLRRLLVQYFVRDFGVFSMLLVSGLGFSAFGLLFGIYHWYVSSITLTIASTGTVMIAVLPLMLGWQLLIQCIFVDMQNIPSEILHTSIAVLEKIQKSLEQQT
jgi:glycosyltransferase involved in cell wall biosynthesis